jgi:hypothetical protein
MGARNMKEQKRASAFEEPINFDHESEEIFETEDIEEEYKKRQAPYPWEHGVPGSRDYLREHICTVYLARIFDQDLEFVHGYGIGFDFKSNEKRYSVRASCLTEKAPGWSCNFGNSRADFILFFGFRDVVNPKLEFCLEIPLDKFRNRTKINISDDGYHLKGFKEFWIDPEKLKKMQDVMVAINDRDGQKIEEYFPGRYRR